MIFDPRSFIEDVFRFLFILYFRLKVSSMDNNGPLPLEDVPVNDFSSPEEIFKQRCRNLIKTQCAKSVEVINEGSKGRPVTLNDFRQTLEQSIKALNVSLQVDNFKLMIFNSFS